MGVAASNEKCVKPVGSLHFPVSRSQAKPQGVRRQDKLGLEFVGAIAGPPRIVCWLREKVNKPSQPKEASNTVPVIDSRPSHL